MRINGSNEQGLVKFVAIIFVLILILSLFRVNVRGQEEDTVQSALAANLELIWSGIKSLWGNYVKPFVVHTWDEYVIPFLTGAFLDGLREKQEERSNLPDDSATGTPPALETATSS